MGPRKGNKPRQQFVIRDGKTLRRLTGDEIHVRTLAPLFASVTGNPPPPRDNIQCPICPPDKFVFGSYYTLIRHVRRIKTDDHVKCAHLVVNNVERYVDLDDNEDDDEEEESTTPFKDIVQDNPSPPVYPLVKNYLPPDSPDNEDEEEDEIGDEEEEDDLDADIDADLAKMCRYCLESFEDKKTLWKHVARHKKRGHESLFGDDDENEKKVETGDTMKAILSEEEDDDEYDGILLKKGIRFGEQVEINAAVIPDVVYPPEAVPIELEVVINPIPEFSFLGDMDEMGNGANVDMGIPSGEEILSSPPISASEIASSSSVSPNDTDDDDSDDDDTSSISDSDEVEENSYADVDSEDLEIEVLTVEETRRMVADVILKDKVRQVLRNLQLGDYAPNPPAYEEDDDDEYPKEFPCTLCSAGFDTASEKEDHWMQNHFFYYQRARRLSNLGDPSSGKDYASNRAILVKPTRPEKIDDVPTNVKRGRGRPPRIQVKPEPTPKFIKPIPPFLKEFYKIHATPPPQTQPLPNRKRTWDETNMTNNKKTVTFDIPKRRQTR